MIDGVSLHLCILHQVIHWQWSGLFGSSAASSFSLFLHIFAKLHCWSHFSFIFLISFISQSSHLHILWRVNAKTAGCQLPVEIT